MSKSYGNTIDIFAEGNALKKPVMSIVTDSTPVADPKDPAKDNVYALYSLVATEEEKGEMAERYRAGGLGYGEVKKALLAKLDSYFAPARARHKELEKHPKDLEDILQEGARKARAEAQKTMDLVRRATGLR